MIPGPRAARCSPFPAPRVFSSPLFSLLPAQSAAHGRPSSSSSPRPTPSGLENPPAAAPFPRTREQPAQVSREDCHFPSPSLQSARTRKEEGAPGDSAADAIILCFSAAQTSPSCSSPTRLRPVGIGAIGASGWRVPGAGWRPGMAAQALPTPGFSQARGLTAQRESPAEGGVLGAVIDAALGQSLRPRTTAEAWAANGARR